MAQASAGHDRKKITPEKVRSNFSKAAESYDRNAIIQNSAAEKLAEMIKSEMRGASPPKLVCEAGCGTGFLTERLLKIFPSANFAISDISRNMLEICRRKALKFVESADETKINFHLHDLNNGAPLYGVDLFVVSMAMQWVVDPKNLVNSIYAALSSGGLFAFSVPGNKTFASIRKSFDEASISYPFNNFFTRKQILKLCSAFEKIVIKHEVLCLKFPSHIDFFRHMKMVGSVNPQAKNLSPSELRQAFKRMDSVYGADGISANFEVIYCLCRKASRAEDC